MFFFQAEDGIRDLVRSRGLGDVYKRQVYAAADSETHRLLVARLRYRARTGLQETGANPLAVSYTHLTLPTSDLV